MLLHYCLFQALFKMLVITVKIYSKWILAEIYEGPPSLWWICPEPNLLDPTKKLLNSSFFSSSDGNSLWGLLSCSPIIWKFQHSKCGLGSSLQAFHKSYFYIPLLVCYELFFQLEKGQVFLTFYFGSFHLFIVFYFVSYCFNFCYCELPWNIREQRIACIEKMTTSFRSRDHIEIPIDTNARTRSRQLSPIEINWKCALLWMVLPHYMSTTNNM